MCYDLAYKPNNFTADYLPGLGAYLDDDRYFSDHIIAHGYPNHPIIFQKDSQMVCRPMEWGVIPFYVKDEKKYLNQRRSMLNARAERILDDPSSYWFKIKNRRCLIPVTGIFEHRGIVGWPKKVPYFISFPDQPIFFLPGLYSVVELPDLQTGEMIKRFTFTLITREANPLLRNIHNSGEHRNRMPLFLPFKSSLEWLESSLDESGYRVILNFEMPESEMDYHPVYTIRGKPRPDGKDKTEYWEWPNLPPLGEKNPPENENSIA